MNTHSRRVIAGATVLALSAISATSFADKAEIRQCDLFNLRAEDFMESVN